MSIADSVVEKETPKILWGFEIQTNHLITTRLVGWLVDWLVRFYGISTFVGYLMPNPFLYK